MVAGKSRADQELTELLTKLYTMQEDVGAKPKTTEEDKKAKAENIAVMGTGRKAQAKGSRFLELRTIIVERIKDLHSKLGEAKELENAGYGGDNPTQLIKIQAEIREEIRQAQDEWKEMDTIYKKEARKKRSKFTPEELETQGQLVLTLYTKIEQIRDIHMSSFGANSASPRSDAAAGILGGVTTYNAGGGGGNKSWGGGGGGAQLTADQRLQIQTLEERDADFDRQLDEIGEGIADLGEIAALQSEEVKHQSRMLDHLNDKIDNVNDRVENVNNRMKETLEEVGRSSDKLCVDIMCIVLALGIGAVLYNLIRRNF